LGARPEGRASLHDKDDIRNHPRHNDNETIITMLTPIPQPPGVPVLGNIFDVNPSNTWASLKVLAEKYGEIFQIKVLNHTIVFVASAALADEVCDEKRFRKYVGGPIVEIRDAVHDSLFTAYDHEASWGVAHRIIAPHLSPAAVRGGVAGATGLAASSGGGAGSGAGVAAQEGANGIDMVKEMNDIVTELFDKWAKLGADTAASTTTNSSSSSNKVLLVDELNRLNLETTTYTLFGQKLNQLSTAKPHPMLKAMEDSTSEAMKRPNRPGLLNWLVYGGKWKKSSKAMRDYAAEAVAHRRSATGAEGERRDLMHALLTAKDPQTGKSLSESEVIDEIVSMPIGSSTAPCLLAAAVYFLLQNPDAVAKAREELDRVSSSSSSAGETRAGFTAEQLDSLAYTQGVLRESMRLSCPAPGFNIEPIPRTTAAPGAADAKGKADKGKVDKAPVLLAGGKYSVAHNQPMIVVLAGVNRDPAVFDAPLEFRPERMMGEQFDALPGAVKKWFGNGKRECIGKHWAWQFSLIALARMIRDVDFESAVGPGWEFKQDGWFNIRPIDFYVKVKPRAV